MALNALHQNYIITKVDSFLTMCMRDHNSAHILKCEKMMSKTSSEYMVHMDMSTADGDEDDTDDAASD